MTVVYLTTASTSPWTVPSDWNSSNNTIEVIGAGGGGSYASTNDGMGGAGGGYAKISNLSLTQGGSVQFHVGSGGAGGTSSGRNGSAGGDTWFNGSTLAGATLGAHGGTGGSDTAGTPGTGGAGVGTGATTFTGGNGGPNSQVNNGSSGGGGAAGPNGNGAAGGTGAPGTAGTGNNSGSGGGGGGGGSAGSSPPSGGSNNGGAGGNNSSGTGGGAGGTYSSSSSTGGSGGAGTAGGGGGGGATEDLLSTGTMGAGGNGGNGTEWDSSHGSGGGGGAGGAQTVNGGTGGAGGHGGLYGGGGGAGGYATGTHGLGGAGADGIIVITYTPVATTVRVLDEEQHRPQPRRSRTPVPNDDPFVSVQNGWVWQGDEEQHAPRFRRWRPPQPDDFIGVPPPNLNLAVTFNPFTLNATILVPPSFGWEEEQHAPRARRWHPPQNDDPFVPVAARPATAVHVFDEEHGAPQHSRRRSPQNDDFIVPPAAPGIQYVRGVALSTTPASSTVTFTGLSLGAGDALVITFQSSNNTLSSVTDNGSGGSYSVVTSALQWSTFGVYQFLVTGFVGTGATSLTFNFSGTPLSFGGAYEEFSGVGSVNATTALANSSSPSDSITTSVAGCALVSLLWDDGSGSPAPTVPSGYSAGFSDPVSTGQSDAYILSVASGSHTITWTGNTATVEVIGAVALAPPGPSPVTVHVFDEEHAPRSRRWRIPQNDDPFVRPPVAAVASAAIYVFDEEHGPRFRRWHPPQNDDPYPYWQAQWVWQGDEEQHQPRFRRWRVPQNDDPFVPLPIAAAPSVAIYVFDEEHASRFRRWRTPQNDDPFVPLPIVAAPVATVYVFDEEHGPRFRRWHVPQNDEFIVPIAAAAVVTAVHVFDEERGPSRRRIWRPNPNEDTLIIPTHQWVWQGDEEQHRPAYRSWRGHGDEGFFLPPLPPSGPSSAVIWFDQEYSSPRHRTWRPPQPEDFVPRISSVLTLSQTFSPFTLSGLIIVPSRGGWEEEQHVPRVRRWHPPQNDEPFVRFTRGVPTRVFFGWEEEQHKPRFRPWHPPQNDAGDDFNLAKFLFVGTGKRVFSPVRLANPSHAPIELWIGQTARTLNQVLSGKLNATASVTLTPNATSTVLFDSRLAISSHVTLMPLSASAAAALASGQIWFVPTKGSVTIHHPASSATDQMFGVLLIG